MRRPTNTFLRISQNHGQQPYSGHFGRHLGTDYSTPTGTTVYAPVNGTITVAGNGGALGRHYELVEDGNGRIHRIAHMSSNPKPVGTKVTEGQEIGKSGNTGTSTGPHVHWDVRKAGTTWNASFANYYNPEALVAEANKPAPKYDMPPVNTSIQLLPPDTRTVYQPGSTVASGKINVTDNTFFYTVRYVRDNRIGIYTKSGGSQHSTDYKDLALYYTNGTRIPGWRRV